MESTYKKTRAPAEENAVRKSREQSRGRARFTPNSAMPGANTGGMGREAMREAMREKMIGIFGPAYVDARAESEADRIGSRYASARNVDDLKERMGSDMGADFSGIRFHTGAEAASQAPTQEESYSQGQDIYLGGAFNPTIAAHEMVHTVQTGAVQAAAPVVSAPAGYVQAWNPFKWIAKKVKKIFKGIKKSHQRAVDAYNNNTKDFKKMSRWERFKWAVKNPIAWMRGGGKGSMKDTEERKKKKDWIEQQAAALSGGGGNKEAAGGEAKEAAGGEKQEEEKVVEKVANGSDGGSAADVGKAVEKAASESGGSDSGESKAEEKAGDKAADENADGGEEEKSGLEKASDINDVIGNVSDYTKTVGETLKDTLGDNEDDETKEVVKGVISKKFGDKTGEKFTKGMDIAAGTVGLVNDVSGVVGNGLSAAQNWKKGDNLEFGKSIGNGVGDLFAVGGDIAGFAGADPVSGALEAVGNGIKTGVSIGSAIANQSTKSKLRERQHKYEDETKDLAGKKNLNEEQKYQLMRARAMGQGKRAASIRRNQDIVDATSSGMKTVGGIAKTVGGPVGSAIGTVASGLGSAAGFIGGGFVEDQKRDLRKKTVNEELNLDAEIEKLKKTMKGPDGEELDDSTAKKIILKSKGFKSGKRKEAFNKITDDRAKALTERANRGDAEEVGIMKDMFVGARKNKDGKEEYNADTVAEKLGKEEYEEEDENPFKTTYDKETQKMMKQYLELQKKLRERGAKV